MKIKDLTKMGLFLSFGFFQKFGYKYMTTLSFIVNGLVKWSAVMLGLKTKNLPCAGNRCAKASLRCEMNKNR